MKELLLLFLLVFLLNLVPAFAPPTWMVFSFVGFRYPAVNVTLLAVIGALAATSGRLVLAKSSRGIIRQKFLSAESKQNIDAIREGLRDRRKLTFGVFLFYAFSPLPSNYLFIAYGLTNMQLRLIAVPFFIGRLVSYSFWGHGSSALSRWLSMESDDALPYMSAYFLISQIVLLYLVYLFTRVDWRGLITEGKFRWLRTAQKSSGTA